MILASRAGFRNEARAVARLSHPHIVSVYDYDQEGDRCFIVMEYVQGPDLKEYISNRRPLSEDEVRRLVSQVLHRLAAAHRAGIIHRDMKPRNVLVSPDGTLKVGDFGVAKAAGDAALTYTGVVFGTPHYLAPEVARGDAATPRSDLYAVGVMLYEMLAGRLPFEGDYAISVVHAHAFEQPPPLGQLAPNVSPEMLAVVQRAMAKDPAERFADAEQMLEALRATEQAERVHPQAAAATTQMRVLPQRAEPKPRRRPVPVARGTGAGPGRLRMRQVWLPLLLLLGFLGITGASLAMLGDGGRAPASSPLVAGQTPSSAPEAAVLAPSQTATRRNPVAIGTEETPTIERMGEGEQPTPEATAITGVVATTAPATPALPTAQPSPEATRPKVATQAPEVAAGEGEVVLYVSSPQGDGLNLKEGPAQDSPRLLVVPPGAPVRAVGPSVKGADGRDWRKATYDGRSGYILNAFLRPTRQAALANSYTRPATSNGTMFRANLSHTGVYGTMPVDEPRGLDWKFRAESGVSRGVTVALGAVYFGSIDTYLYSVDAKTGRRKWRFKTGAIPSAPPAVAGKLVYFGSDDSYVYALDRDTGQLRWKFKTGDRVPSGPAVADGVAYFGSWDTYLYAVDARTGTELWRFKTGGRIASSPAVAGGVVYFGSDDTFLYAVDIRTKQQRWRFDTGQRVYSSPAVANGVVYVGSWDRYLYAVDAASGDRRWSFQTGGRISSSPAVTDEAVYFGSWDGNLYAVDALTGEQEWRFRTGGRVFSSPAVVGKTIYFGSDDRHLYAADIATGQPRWQFQTGGAVPSSPAAADGAVYFGSMDGHLYALR
ncbi:MAG: PQQ-binding-like beta-propeller repeat protein [Chloroflexota bacterium]|nr:PQQ-binding-like beta-propeller repeat protein [Chloroflexota bacterium]